MLVFKVLLWASIFLIFYSFIGYPISLIMLNKIIKKKSIEKDSNLTPFVSVIIPAHNEEDVIEDKLKNLISLNYPKNLMETIIASDNSTDSTNQIVEKFIEENKEYDINLYKVNKRQGKTNAQNEAVKIAKGDILMFSDANAMLDRDSVQQLVSSFVSKDIIYVTGRLRYVNNIKKASSEAENRYWNYDLTMRKIESDIQTITAGNGAIYAIRKSEYIDFDPIRCHDSAMPLYAGINNKRAIYNENALAYEKAGETSQDEFKRKVRMFRGILRAIFETPKKYNIIKNGWFSYFYFGHRTLRNSLFILHIICFIMNLLVIKQSIFYNLIFFMQCLFYFLALSKKFFGFENKLFYYPYYYSMTLIAQLVGAINQLTGKSKPFWEKAESTR
ncbi:glycosyltransferase family 2 protein [Clostridium sp. D2Q-14]|uniref:glycosyltransferase family 2 protein n=1 Tax=Anaeromonas gelatinilytica TaxID=2683194 RepID=UPI00193B6830|nr:glycosyltransferase family 2 protein [Anaeromonas gelatinilytica]MBS4534481.1 glycosyltransferase family 2 protein [Anaeromonas gelatinilytica]